MTPRLRPAASERHAYAVCLQFIDAVLRKAHPDQVTIERFDITEPDQIVALRDRLSGHVFDMLFVYAGIAKHNQAETIPQLVDTLVVQQGAAPSLHRPDGKPVPW